MKTILAHILILFAVFTGYASVCPDDSVKIYFRIGYSQFEPNLENNRRNLDSFVEKVREAMAKGTLDSISVSAYASPDGISSVNQRLSRRRCATMASLIEKKTGLPRDMIHSHAEGVAWKELRTLVAANPDVPRKEQVLDILDNTPLWIRDAKGNIVGGRKKKLMDLAGGRPYNWLYSHIFPELRNGVAIAIYLKPTADEKEITDVPDDSAEEAAAPEIESDTKNTDIGDVAESVEETVISEVEQKPVSDNYKPLHRFALKNNIIFDAALMPNLEFEWMVAPRWSVAAEGGIAWWYNDNTYRSYRFAYADLEGRFWAYERARWHGLYVGVLGGGAIYDLENRGDGYKGEGVFAGASCGYMWPISRNFSLETAVAFGYATTKYKQYRPFDGHKIYLYTKTLNYFGPIKLKFNIVWRFGDENKHKMKSEI